MEALTRLQRDLRAAEATAARATAAAEAYDRQRAGLPLDRWPEWSYRLNAEARRKIAEQATVQASRFRRAIARLEAPLSEP